MSHKNIFVGDTITVVRLARVMGVDIKLVSRELWGMGLEGLTPESSIDFDTAKIVADRFRFTAQHDAFNPHQDPEMADETAPKIFLRTTIDPSTVIMLDTHIEENRRVLLAARETALHALKAVDSATAANQAVCSTALRHKFENDNCVRCGLHKSPVEDDGPSFNVRR